MKRQKLISIMLSVAMAFSVNGAIVYADTSDEELQAYQSYSVENQDESDQNVIENDINEEIYETEKEIVEDTDIPADSTEFIALGTCGTNANWKLDTEGTLTVYGSGAMSNYRIYYDMNGDWDGEWDTTDQDYGEPQTPWKSYLDQIYKVEIQSGITSIGEAAFMNCNNLVSVETDDPLTSIGNNAFVNCSSLVKVEGMENVTELSDFAFYKCTELSDIQLNPNMAKYGQGCLYNCYSVPGISVTENTVYLGDYALTRCYLLEKAMISSNISTFRQGVFNNCKNLKEVTLPANLKCIPARAFQGCESLAEMHFPEGLEEIGGYAFNRCYGLTEVTIPGTVKKFGDSKPFYNCTGLKKVVFQEGSGNSTILITGKTFANCCHLEEIVVPSTMTKFAVVDGNLLSADKKTLYVPAPGNAEEVRIPDCVETIGCYAICNYSNRTFVLSSSIRKIDDLSIYACSNVTLRFEGDAPSMINACFYQSKLTIEYPEIASGWNIKPSKGGTVTMKSYNPTAKYDLADCDMRLDSPAKAYNGSTPEVSIKLYYNGELLTEGVDYKYTVVANSGKTVKNGILHVKAYTAGGNCEYGGICDKTFMLADRENAVSAAKAASGIKVSWESESKAVGYYIYRRGTKTDWTRIATVTGASKHEYYDKTVSSTYKYYYCVVAYNKSGSDTGTYRYLSCGDSNGVTYVERPTLYTPYNSSKGVSLSWNVVSEATGYCILRKEVGEDSFKTIKTITDMYTSSYTDTKAEANKTYVYSIKAYYQGASGTKYYSIYSTVGKTIRFLKMPVLGTATAEKTGIRFTWEYTDGVTGYYIYRRTDDNDDWVRIKIISNPKASSTKDYTVESGVTYHYAVAAYVNVNGKYYVSAKSEKGISA